MWIKVIVVAVLFIVVQHVLKVVYNLGFHLHFNKHYPGRCQTVKGIGLGSENFHVFKDGLTFITSGVRFVYEDPARLEYLADQNITGRIYLFDFNYDHVEAHELKIVDKNELNYKIFSPHGISGWTDKHTGEKYVFIVNHEINDEDVVEKFLYIPDKKHLKHVTRYQHESMQLLNDVQATGKDSFYYTNYATSHNPIVIQMQMVTMLSINTVGYFNGENYKIVLEGMGTPNGIAMSHDGKYVYIGATLTKELIVSERLPNDDLVIKQAYPVYTALDNVIVDVNTDDLYIGAHPILIKAVYNYKDPYEKSPSQVLKLSVQNGNITGVSEVFYDHGDMITASSTAIVYNSKLLIGSILDTLVYCDVMVPL